MCAFVQFCESIVLYNYYLAKECHLSKCFGLLLFQTVVGGVVIALVPFTV